MNAATLTEALKLSADKNTSLTLISSDTEEQCFTYAELFRRAQGILFHLQQQIKPKQELIIYVDDNQQFLEVFWACLLGNIVPVPIAVSANDQHRQKIINVFNKLHSPFIYTARKIQERLELFADAKTINIDNLMQQILLIENIHEIDQPGNIIPPSPWDIALLQFSSGSTGNPKGIILTHENILTNIHAMIQAAKLSPSDQTLSWMPLTHDMGIIGFHLTPLVASINQYIIPTDLFIRRPLLWLKKASEKKATVLSSPNFGYQHCLKRFSPDKLAGCDLQHVRLILNGAEPISVKVCREFTSTLKEFNLNPNSIFPVYGLAEASLAVSFPKPGHELDTITIDRRHLALGDSIQLLDAADKNAVEIVGVGTAVPDCELGIFHQEQAAANDQLGLIKIRGNNVTKGYYSDAEKTNDVINKQGWLDTGDVGFLHQGRLFIIGRTKELVIISGQNFMAQDIERTASGEDLTSEKIVACGVRSPQTNSEELLLFAFYKGTPADFVPIQQAITHRLRQQLSLVPLYIIPISKIPKTTSGKIQRYLLVEQFHQGAFNELINRSKPGITGSNTEFQASKNHIEKAILDICHMHIKQPISTDNNIFDIGTNSLTLAQIYDDINLKYPDKIEVTDIFDYPTVSQLSAYIESKL